MRYKIIDMQIASDLARSKLAGESVECSKHEQEIGSGQPLSDAVLLAIAQDIKRIRKSIEKSEGDRTELDRRAFEVVHRKLPNDPDILGDSRFWGRFALVFLFDTIVWRFPGKKAGFNLENLGLSSSIGRRRENYLYKLWMRGELSRQEKGGDPYRLGRFGDIDFWTSHVHRQGFSNCRSIAMEFIRYQYPSAQKGVPRLFHGEEESASGEFGVST